MLFKIYRKTIITISVLLLFLVTANRACFAQESDTIATLQTPDSTILEALTDSISVSETLDSTMLDTKPKKYEVKKYKVENGRLVESNSHMSLIEEASIGSDSTRIAIKSLSDTLTRAERRTMIKESKERNPFITFRDSMPISRVCWFSVPLPGFSQVYNKQYYKLPILYGTVGASALFYIKQNKKYKSYKSDYDYLISIDESRDLIDPVQTKMIKHNTYRQIFLGTAVASYMYFLGDGALNYKYKTTNVKMATTLSMICPGAGQVYNGSFWKAPIVLGSFATMAYMIDFNNRGYKRFKTAYDLLTDGDDLTVDEFYGRYSASTLGNIRKSYRRNRDLCIIATAGLYILNIVDAHVDAHLQDYDISDNLASLSLQPTILDYYSSTYGYTQGIGLNLTCTF